MPAPLDADDVKAALASRWADFYGQFTTLKPLGGELRGPCPLHGGAGANFAVNPETGLWNCFSRCQDGGDAFRFLEKKDGLAFPEALAQVADFAGVAGAPLGHGAAAIHGPRPSPRKPPLPKPPPDTFLDIGIAEDLHDRLMRSDSMRLWLSEHRGLTTETLARFGIGMQKDEQGLYRVCFPVRDAGGRLINIRRHLFAYKEGLDRKFKTLPWEKGLPSLLFPLSALDGADEALLVEGEADAALACQMGFAAVSGTLGAGNWKPQWTEEMRGLRRVTLLYDADGPGQDGAQKVAAAIAPVVPDVRLARVGGGKDLTEWAVEHGAMAADVQEAINAAVPFLLPSGAAESAWEPPVPFGAHALPPFPVEALPDALAGMVGECAQSIQVPPDLPAMMGLAALAAAAAPRCLVRIGTTHAEPLNLYCAAVMGPGGRKSAAVEAMAAPLRDAEREMADAALPGLLAAQEARAVGDKRLAYLREMAAKAKDPAQREDLVRELGETAAALEDPPAVPRLLADDVTPEKLAALMAEQRGAMALLSAEGGIFGILAGRYSDGKANLDLFLKGHAGEDVRVDRKSGPPVHIPRACLTMGLAVQPDVLASLSDTPAFRGRGLLGRFLYALPEDLAGTRMYQDRPVAEAARARYARAVRAILSLPDADREGAGARHVLGLTGDALEAWREGADDVERRQADGGDLAGVRDWASKLAGAVARIAGVFHLLETGGGRPWDVPIAAETVLMAWAVGEYLIPHALAAYGQMGADPALLLARRILGWVRRTASAGEGGEGSFTLRECQRAHGGGGSALSSDDVQAALALLTDRGYIRPEGGRQVTGGRPGSAAYAVNPAALAGNQARAEH